MVAIHDVDDHTKMALLLALVDAVKSPDFDYFAEVMFVLDIIQEQMKYTNQEEEILDL